MAKMLPEAKIIVTGGVPRNDKSEGIEMKQWLIAQGIDENRIIAEKIRDRYRRKLYLFTLHHQTSKTK